MANNATMPYLIMNEKPDVSVPDAPCLGDRETNLGEGGH